MTYTRSILIQHKHLSLIIVENIRQFVNSVFPGPGFWYQCKNMPVNSHFVKSKQTKKQNITSINIRVNKRWCSAHDSELFLFLLASSKRSVNIKKSHFWSGKLMQRSEVAKVFDLSSFPYLPTPLFLTAFLPFLPPLSIPVGINMDSILFSLSLSFCSTLALFLGPEDHVGESHEHLQT